MHCIRTPELDLPQYLRDRIKDSISLGSLVETNMGKDKPMLEDVLSKIDDVARREYFKSVYHDFSTSAFTLDAELEKQIVEYYSSFFLTIDEQPRITIKCFISVGGLPLHSDKKQTSSLTTLISGEGPMTEWYYIKEKFKHIYCENDEVKPNSLPMPHEVELAEAHMLQEWQSGLFDHRTVHKVNTGGVPTKRIMLCAGLVNTPYLVLEQKYKEWKKLC